MNPDYYLHMANTEASHWWHVGRRAIISDVIKNLKLPIDINILEIGSGTGGNLEMLSSFGKVSGLEMDSTAITIAQNKTAGRIDIRQGFFPKKNPFSNNKFDLICLFDVLEHIDNDTETLSIVKKLLVKGGSAIITVPAYQWLWSSHDEYLHHKRRYSTDDMRSKIRNTGYTLLKISHFNTFLFPLAVIVRLMDKKAGSGGRDVPQPFLNKFLAVLFSAERHLIRYCNIPYGVSLLCIIQNEH